MKIKIVLTYVRFGTADLLKSIATFPYWYYSVGLSWAARSVHAFALQVGRYLGISGLYQRRFLLASATAAARLKFNLGTGLRWALLSVLVLAAAAVFSLYGFLPLLVLVILIKPEIIF